MLSIHAFGAGVQRPTVVNLATELGGGFPAATPGFAPPVFG